MDHELISQEEFNYSFKDLLRDFYVYQFKENTTDFKTNSTLTMKKKRGGDKGDRRGADSGIVYDVPLSAATFSDSKRRLQNIFCQETAIKWTEKTKVACATTDSANIRLNPFYKLYKNCNEATKKESGRKYALILSLLLYLSEKTCLAASDSPDGETWEEAKHLIESYIGDVDGKAYFKDGELTFSRVSHGNRVKLLADYIQNPPNGDNDVIYSLMRSGWTVALDSNGELQPKRLDVKPSSREKLYPILKNCTGLSTKHRYTETAFHSLLDDMTELGFLEEGADGEYRLSDITAETLLNCGEGDFRKRLEEFILFASNNLPLGVLGASLLERFSVTDGSIVYKHNYLIHALNDYNMIDLLNVLTVNESRVPSRKLWLKLECRDANVTSLKHEEIICLPLEVRESTVNGRQYLIYYHHKNRSVESVRIDFIDRIHIGRVNVTAFDFEAELKKAEEILEYTFGVTFDGFEQGNVCRYEGPHVVEALLTVNDKEKVIADRVEKEKPRHTEVESFNHEKYGRCIRLTVRTAGTRDVCEWIKTFICRIVYLKVDGIESACGRASQSILEVYNGNASFKRGTLFDKSDFTPADIFGRTLTKKDREPVLAHKHLFNEYFSKELFDLGRLTLGAVSDGEFTEESRRLFAEEFSRRPESMQYDSVTEKRREQAENFTDAFFGSGLGFRFRDGEAPDVYRSLLPLSRAERLWLTQAVCSSYADYFFDRGEIESIKDILRINDSLFDISEVKSFDQYKGETCSGDSFRRILEALREKKGLEISYIGGSGKHQLRECIPVRLEYSKRDHVFRLFAVNPTNAGEIFSFRMGRIDRVESRDITSPESLAFESKKASAVILFDDRKNIPDSILNEFSFCEKICEKAGDKTYELTLRYDEGDLYDIVIRLLKYGEDIYVSDGRALIGELKTRLEQQLELERMRFE